MKPQDKKQGDRGLGLLVEQWEEMCADGRVEYFECTSFEDLSSYYEQRNEIGKALEVCQIAGEQHPFTSFFFIKQAEFFLEQEEILNALDMLTKARSLDSEEIRIMLIEAAIHIHQKQFAYALSLVDDIKTLISEKELNQYLQHKIENFRQMENLRFELVYLQLSALSNYESSNTFQKLADFVSRNKLHEESIRFQKQILDERPFAQNVWIALGDAFSGIQLFEKAIEAYSYAIAIDGNEAEALLKTGENLLHLDQFNEAVEVLEESLKVGGDEIAILLLLGKTLLKLDRSVEAKNCFQRVLQLETENKAALFEVAEIDRLNGDFEKSLKRFEQLIKLEPDNLRFKQLYAQLSHLTGNYQNAVEIYLEAIRENPYNKELWLELSSCYFDLEYYTEAIDVIFAALDMLEDDADLMYICFVYLVKAGRKSEGFEYLERALSIDFQKHELLFDLYPEFENQTAASLMIEQFRP